MSISVKIFWSLAERIFPRAGTALVLLLTAAFTSPSEVGVYSWMVLAYTCAQAISDSAARQIMVGVVQVENDHGFYLRYLRWTLLLTPTTLIVVATIVIMSHDERVDNLVLYAIAFAPVAVLAGLRSVARLQAAGEWRTLATIQALSSSTALLISIPVLVVTQSIIGPVLHLLITELINTAAARRAARAITVLPVPPRDFGRAFSHMAAYSALAWGQGQMERVMLGAFAGTEALGRYAVGAALGRAAGDALGAASANVLRARVLMTSPAQAAVAASRILTVSVVAACGLSVLTIVGSRILVDPLLSSTWDESLQLVPVLALTAMPSVLAWCSGVLHVTYGTASRSLAAPLAGILLCFPVAIVGRHDLVAATWLVLLRDVVLVIVAYGMMGRHAPRIPLVVGTFLLGGMALLTLVTDYWREIPFF